MTEDRAGFLRRSARFLRRGDPLAFCVRAAALLILFPLLSMTRVFERCITEPLIAADVWATHGLLKIFGTATEFTGRFVMSPEFSIEVIPGCTGIYTILILAAMILAFPASWKARLAGFLGGFLLISILNIVRLVTLFIIGKRYPELFEEVHLFVWQAITILIALLFWYLWARRSLGVLAAAGARAGDAA